MEQLSKTPFNLCAQCEKNANKERVDLYSTHLLAIPHKQDRAVLHWQFIQAFLFVCKTMSTFSSLLSFPRMRLLCFLTMSSIENNGLSGMQCTLCNINVLLYHTHIHSLWTFLTTLKAINYNNSNKLGNFKTFFCQLKSFLPKLLNHANEVIFFHTNRNKILTQNIYTYKPPLNLIFEKMQTWKSNSEQNS